MRIASPPKRGGDHRAKSPIVFLPDARLCIIARQYVGLYNPAARDFDRRDTTLRSLAQREQGQNMNDWLNLPGCNASRKISVAILASVLGAGTMVAQTNSGERLKVAFFGFEMINTSPEPTSDAEKKRLRTLEETLTKMLAESGRYEVVPLSDALKETIERSARITGCNGCQIEWARKAGADLAVWGVVQKVSNLILNENVYMEDAKTGRAYFGQSVDIRGNTDESWTRGMRYLLRYNLLEKR
jgi:hypothetical protein